MTHNVMLVPAGKAQGLFPVTLGLVKALNQKGVKAVLFKPFSDVFNDPVEKRTLCVNCATKQVAKGQRSEVLESIVANFNSLVAETSPEVVIIEGVEKFLGGRDRINAETCHALDADILSAIPGKCGRAKMMLENTLRAFGEAGKKRVLGTVLLNPDAPHGKEGERQLSFACECDGPQGSCSAKANAPAAITNIIATLHFDQKLYAPRARDLAVYLDGKVSSGSENTRVFKAVLPGQGEDEGAALIAVTKPDSTACGVAVLPQGLGGAVSGAGAVIETALSPLDIAAALRHFPALLPYDDTERKDLAEQAGAAIFDQTALQIISQYDKERIPLMSPASFRSKLTSLARAAHKRIALPEGDEPRTVKAAAEVARQNIAVPVLFGNKEHILEVAKELDVSLGEGVEFVEPEAVRNNYVDRLVELRQKKGMTPELAVQMLQDNVALATMMIERGELDGLVSGAVHTTANTIRPALQIIKTAPNSKLVSGSFFMLMPEQVYLFADCAINLNPTADELSEIAIQSADTAKAFGIDPKVAMITYSTLKSGKGADVDLVTQATELVRQKRPDIAVDGPLQYDAAVEPAVAAQKAPGSPVAGKATVFIFPSLSTGNTVYKAVQRSAGVVSVGPLLQGLKKPVNDLSRGALVDDIVYTIAVTAIQATMTA
ncbi:MAG: phosphate acetyltransferase [Succinivibrio sp.]|nr:phosphate acetyltransferase [Succinivibrio sp.]